MIKASEVALYFIAVIIVIGMVGVAFQAFDDAPTPEQIEKIKQPIAIIEEEEDLIEEEIEKPEPPEPKVIAPQGDDEKKYRRAIFPRLRKLLGFRTEVKINSEKCEDGSCPKPQ